jgi:hypothetical protein
VRVAEVRTLINKCNTALQVAVKSSLCLQWSRAAIERVRRHLPNGQVSTEGTKDKMEHGKAQRSAYLLSTYYMLFWVLRIRQLPWNLHPRMRAYAIFTLGQIVQCK